MLPLQTWEQGRFNPVIIPLSGGQHRLGHTFVSKEGRQGSLPPCSLSDRHTREGFTLLTPTFSLSSRRSVFQSPCTSASDSTASKSGPSDAKSAISSAPQSGLGGALALDSEERPSSRLELTHMSMGPLCFRGNDPKRVNRSWGATGGVLLWLLKLSHTPCAPYLTVPVCFCVCL